MYRKILLAYDGTLEGRTALREGAILAHRCQAEVFLLSIVAGPPSADALGSAAAGPEHAERIFAEGLAKAKEYGLKSSGFLVHGDPLTEIRDHAHSLNVDLVVVGHRKKSFLERWWSGPSHAFLIDNLDCSLLIAQHDPEKLAALEAARAADAIA